MIASVACQIATVRHMPPMTAVGQEARDMALACLRYESACWRGESAHEFAMRLGSYWRPELPPAPTTEQAAYSPHGGGGRGISWFEKSGEILGYIAGRRSGYRIPATAVAALVRCVPQHPCQLQRSPEMFGPHAVVH
jgi:hypothetical protein